MYLLYSARSTRQMPHCLFLSPYLSARTLLPWLFYRQCTYNRFRVGREKKKNKKKKKKKKKKKDYLPAVPLFPSPLPPGFRLLRPFALALSLALSRWRWVLFSFCSPVHYGGGGKNRMKQKKSKAGVLFSLHFFSEDRERWVMRMKCRLDVIRVKQFEVNCNYHVYAAYSTSGTMVKSHAYTRRIVLDMITCL